jgi:hypothetical protein
MKEIRIIYEQSTPQKPPTKQTTMVKEMISFVVVVDTKEDNVDLVVEVEAEEANMDLVVEVEVVDDHIVLIDRKMIMTTQIFL